MKADEFRRLGHLLIDWIADYRERTGTLPVMSQVKPGYLKTQLPKEAPRTGESLDGLLQELDALIVPGITHWHHPRFFAYFPSNADLSSVLGDLIAAGLGANVMAWQTSPAGTELEEVTLEWLRKLVGLPDDFSGVIQDTASASSLVALLCAREKSSGFGQTRGGLQAEEKALTVYASDQAHSSVEKAALLAGFGRENVRIVPTDAAFALDVAALRRMVEEDVAAGKRPCALVGTVGTTATTAIDPLVAMNEVAQAHGLWLHVDAAMAGSAMILPEQRHQWRGIEHADSLVFNPHKWLGPGFDLSAYYVRDPQHLIRVMSTNPSYLRTPHDREVKNFRDWGIPLGRRFRALKLWLVLRSEGAEGLQRRLARDLDFAQWLKAQVDAAAPEWERMAPVPFQTVCVRHRPPGLTGEALDRHNAALAAAINATGQAYVTAAVVRGVQLIRCSIGSATTQRSDVEALWALMQKTARELTPR